MTLGHYWNATDYNPWHYKMQHISGHSDGKPMVSQFLWFCHYICKPLYFSTLKKAGSSIFALSVGRLVGWSASPSVFSLQIISSFSCSALPSIFQPTKRHISLYSRCKDRNINWSFALITWSSQIWRQKMIWYNIFPSQWYADKELVDWASRRKLWWPIPRSYYKCSIVV